VSTVASSSASSLESTRINPKLAAQLADQAVTETSFARRVLFSWTTREQAEILRRDKHLLLDTELPSGPTPYVELLGKAASGKGPNADFARVLLLHPSLRLRRYAWSRPWPTAVGVADRAYGDQLLRVVLAPSAIVARFDPSRPDVFAFQDLDGRAVSLGEVLSDPSRVAAVLHVRKGADSPVAYREYVLCNEAMVTEWSLATPAIRAAVDEDVALLGDIAKAGLTSRSPLADVLAFDTDRYGPSQAAFSAISDAMRRTDLSGAPLTVTPSATFAIGAVVPNVALRVPPVRVLRVI